MAPAFLGSGIALELVRRSTEDFEEVLDASAPAASVRSLVGASTGIVSIMDRDAARLARESAKPLYVVDSLLWMRDRIPDVFSAARRYWAQRFFGKTFDSHDSPVVSVGPIVSAFQPAPPLQKAELVVHLGGCESPAAAAKDHHRYARFVTRSLVSSGVPREASSIVLSGAACAARLDAEFSGCGVAFASLAHQEALNVLSNAALVLTSPGVTATLECFQAAVATSFLPPQNYSQWLALEALRSAGLAEGAFHWTDVTDPLPFATMPEERRTPLVLATIARLGVDNSVSDELARCLRAATRLPRAELRARQHAAFSTLGANGSLEIAAQLAAEA
jgi:hypothetical protein